MSNFKTPAFAHVIGEDEKVQIGWASAADADGVRRLDVFEKYKTVEFINLAFVDPETPAKPGDESTADASAKTTPAKTGTDK